MMKMNKRRGGATVCAAILFSCVLSHKVGFAATCCEVGARTQAFGDDGVTPPRLSAEMDDQTIGQLNAAFAVADAELADFRLLEPATRYGNFLPSSGQISMDSYRYGIAFLSYYLALVQFHYLPAWPEGLQPRFTRLIQKMLLKPVWEFWEKRSQGAWNIEPGALPIQRRFYPMEKDPVRVRNIMYKGHLAHMLALYEKLYADLSFSEPGAITFVNGKDRFLYSTKSLIDLMFRELVNHPVHCIECEPNLCFPECNQHAMLAFMLHDQNHGTEYFPTAKPLFMHWFDSTKMIDEETHETSLAYLIKQKKTINYKSLGYGNIISALAAPFLRMGLVNLKSGKPNGWNGMFMHAWNPELIERHYPFQMQSRLVPIDDKTATLKHELQHDQLSVPFMTMLAAEVGDVETRDKLLRWMDLHYKPIWKDGTFTYPAGRDVDYNPLRRYVGWPGNLTGRLIGIARGNGRGGMWALHNLPYEGREKDYPLVTKVSKGLVLRRAAYADDGKSLVVATAPLSRAEDAGGEQGFVFTRLAPEQRYRVVIDGKEKETFSGRSELEIALSSQGERHSIVLERL